MPAVLLTHQQHERLGRQTKEAHSTFNTELHAAVILHSISGRSICAVNAIWQAKRTHFAPCKLVALQHSGSVGLGPNKLLQGFEERHPPIVDRLRCRPEATARGNM